MSRRTTRFVSLAQHAENCSLGLCRVWEPVESSAMDCIGCATNETVKIRLSVSAKLVSRCGVERNIIDEMDLMIAL